MQIQSSYKDHWKTISNGEFSDPLCEDWYKPVFDDMTFISSLVVWTSASVDFSRSPLQQQQHIKENKERTRTNPLNAKPTPCPPESPVLKTKI